MGEGTRKCMVCAREHAEGGSICPACQARIRGEVLERQKQVRKDAEKELHRQEGEPPKKG